MWRSQIDHEDCLKKLRGLLYATVPIHRLFICKVFHPPDALGTESFEPNQEQVLRHNKTGSVFRNDSCKPSAVVLHRSLKLAFSAT